MRVVRSRRYSTASELYFYTSRCIIALTSSSSYICDETMASFTSITQEQLLSPRNLHPPDNCPPCLLLSQQEQERMITPIRDGIAYRGHNFHKYDFVLCNNADAGPAHIGQILRLISSRGRNSAPDSVLVRVLGRIGDIISICQERIVKDEVCSHHPEVSGVS